MSVDDVLDEARDRGLAAIEARPSPDYAGVNAHHRKQRAALTRAINSGDPEKVKVAVVRAVREWRQPPYNGFWPDDWARWQAALNDVLPWNASVELEDIR